jgi:exosortase A
MTSHAGVKVRSHDHSLGTAPDSRSPSRSATASGASRHSPTHVDEYPSTGKEGPTTIGYAAALRLSVLIAAAAGVFLLYSPTLLSIIDLWSYEGFRHCWLIPVISTYLLWLRRHELIGSPWRFSWPGVLALAGAVWFWVVGKNLALQVLEQLSLVLILNAFVWSLIGTRAYRRVMFPLLFLFLAVPFGQESIPILMEITADISAWALHLVGVPVFREGAFMTLPGGSFEVAESCSGFHYVNAGFAISLLVAYLTFSNRAVAAAYVLLFTLVCVLLNGIRAFLVMWIASATNMQHMTGEDHVVFGWVLFGAAILGMIWIAGRISREEQA